MIRRITALFVDYPKKIMKKKNKNQKISISMFHKDITCGTTYFTCPIYKTKYTLNIQGLNLMLKKN